MRMLLTCGVVLAAAAAVPAQEPAKPAAKPTKIGFVNVKQVVDEYKRVKHENELIRKRGERLEKKIDELNAKMKDLSEKLRMFEPGVRYDDTKREILELQQKIKFEQEWARYAISADGAKVLVEIYQEMLKAVRAHAAREGYTLILKIEDDKMDTDQRFEVELRLNLRAVLYHDPDHDITKPVIEALNAAWDKVKPPPDKEPDPDPKGAPGNGPGGEKPAGGGEKSGAGGDQKSGG